MRPVPSWQASDDAQRQKQLEQEQRNTQVAGFASLGGIALLVTGSLGLLLLWYTRGKDPAAGVVASFLPEPPDATPPAVVGVLIDEKADEHDIVSTIVDLGNRGVLVIHDQPGQPSSIELTNKQAAMSPFEQRLVHALFPNADKGAKSIPYATASYSINANSESLKVALYQEVVDRGFFKQSPEQTRGRWRGIATAITSISILAGIAGSFLISPWLLVPAFAVTALSLILRQVARTLPKRTEAGAEAAAKWRAFERYLADLDKYDSVDTAKANFDRYLPYAIAFGLEKVWVARFESAQSANPGWLNPGDVAHRRSRQIAGIRLARSDHHRHGRQSKSRRWERRYARCQSPRYEDARPARRERQRRSRPHRAPARAASISSMCWAGSFQSPAFSSAEAAAADRPAGETVGSTSFPTVTILGIPVDRVDENSVTCWLDDQRAHAQALPAHRHLQPRIRHRSPAESGVHAGNSQRPI